MAANIQPDDDPFGPFTVAEVENCFKAFDLDNNTFVGAGELRKVYQYLGENATDEDIDEMIKMCDQDGDGQITFDEFARMIFRHSGPPKTVLKPKTKLLSPKEQEDIMNSAVSKQKLRPIQSTITSYNKEEKQAIDSPVMKVMTQKERADRAFVLENMIKQIRMDAASIDDVHANFLKECNNPNGMVTYQQFCKAINNPSSNPICQSLFKLFQNDQQRVDFRGFLVGVVHVIASNKALKIKYVFNIFDVDGNKKLDRSELEQILKSTNMATSKVQVQNKVNAILTQSGTQNPGELTFDEFQSAVTKFPNLIFPVLNT